MIVTPTIDYMNSHIQEKIQELINQSEEKNLNKWIRLNAQGSNEKINAYFSLDEEYLAYLIGGEFWSIDYMDSQADFEDRLVNILSDSENILDITTDFQF